MLDFKPLELEHIELLRQFFSTCRCRTCDCTVGGTFMWRDYYNTEFALEDGILYLRVEIDGRTAFTAPLGSQGPEAYGKILEYCAENGITPEFCMVSEPRLPELEGILPGYEAWSDRTWSDYLYAAEDLREMAGRKYSAQRNHINKFMRENPDWSFETVGPENLTEARSFLSEYVGEHTKDSETLVEGDRKALEILDNFDIYGLPAGILRAGGKVIGISIGEIVGDTLFIHTEKSEKELAGSYQMLVREFARAFAGDGVEFINREEDDGDEGLRKSKLSYHPVRLLAKYAVRPVEGAAGGEAQG
jgi:hypothetical protein